MQKLSPQRRQFRFEQQSSRGTVASVQSGIQSIQTSRVVTKQTTKVTNFLKMLSKRQRIQQLQKFFLKESFRVPLPFLKVKTLIQYLHG